MKSLVIIPARGGSKGIPRKNVIPLAGKPLLGWTIEAAQKAMSVDHVVVSTDDKEIADCAESFGAMVVMRPVDLAGDQSSSESALLHALEELSAEKCINPDVTLFLQCTSPLTIPEDIDGAMELMYSGHYDSLFSASHFHSFVWKKDSHGGAVGLNHDHTKREMRQQREEQFRENGAMYIIKTDLLRNGGYRFAGKVGMYEMPVSRHLEIDEPYDLLLAQSIMSSRIIDRGMVDEMLAAKLRQVQLVVTDFDGVLTNNCVYMSETGEENVRCNRGDGWAIGLLKNVNLDVICVSTEKNPIVQKRCEKLKIECHTGQEDKASRLQTILETKGIDAQNCLYIGNDTNDAGCLRMAGVAVVPRDAAREVKPLADLETEVKGGDGVLREVASLIIKVRNEDGR